MQEIKLIEPKQTESASPVVFVPKKEEEIGFCPDYRKLNAATVRDSYPLPRMDECLDFLVNAETFSTLDENSG